MTDFNNIVYIMEPEGEFTESQLQTLEDDVQLRIAAEDIILAENCLAKVPDDAEIEERLEKFKASHGGQGQVIPTKKYGTDEAITMSRGIGSRKVAKFISMLAAAAAAIACLLVFYPAKEDTPSYLFERDSETASTLTDENGQSLAIHEHHSSEPDPVIIAKEYSVTATGSEIDTIRLNVTKGQSFRIDLSDGSKVFLHPGSKLLYPTLFKGSKREVHLQGEAYFIVAKDAKHPFYVHTERSVTKVLGTEFNLCSSAGEAERLVLVNGHVRMSGINTSSSVDVLPGHEAVLASNGFINVNVADTMEYVSWRDGFIYYDKSSLGFILEQICSIYNVNIECKDKSILNTEMHFVLRRDKDIHEAIHTINNMKKVKASLRNNTLVVTK